MSDASYENRTHPFQAEASAHTSDRFAELEKLLGPTVCRRLGIYPLPDGFLLSVVIPVFNEVRTIDEVMADFPPAQQEEIERRYQALRRTLPLSQRDKAPDDVLRPKA